MPAKAFTILELLVVLVVLGLILAFTFPNLDIIQRQRALQESADELRSLVMMTHARAMADGIRYRIEFPGTPDPLDPRADREIDVPWMTLQPIVKRQVDPLMNPEAYGDVHEPWTDRAFMREGTRCVAVLPGRPSFEIRQNTPIAGPSIAEGDKTVFVPLTFNPDGTCDWVTFVLTDLPFDVELEASHAPRILNVIVDGRTGQSWVQRALRAREVEIMQEHGASPILHIDFTSPTEITEDNILEVHIRPGGGSSTGSGAAPRRRSEGGS